MVICLHLSAYMGHYYYTMRAILGFLYSLDRAADLYGQNFAFECTTERISFGVALSERLVSGTWHIELRRRSSRSSNDLAFSFIQIVEHSSLIGAQSQFFGCYLGWM